MPAHCYRLFALCCFGLALCSGAAFGRDHHSGPYPRELHARPVAIVSGGSFQRHYWDPRCAVFCPWPRERQRLCAPDRVYP